MRLMVAFLALSVGAWSQALTEAAAAAAGGTVGGVAGKKVGEGVGNILEKVAASAAKAADGKDAKPTAPALQVGPGVPQVGAVTPAPPKPTKPAVAKASKPDRSLVPPPPPIVHRGPVKPDPEPVPEPVVEAAAPPPPPPPPVVTPEDLKKLSNGMERVAVLKLGAPASRVTMAESGHLLEIFNYVNRDKNFGTVRLNDGVVSSVEVHP